SLSICRQTGRADGRRIPGVLRRVTRLIEEASPGRGQRCPARLQGSLPISGQITLYCFDERRQGGFGVRSDREIDLRVALEILMIPFRVQVARRQADQLRAALGRQSGSSNQLIQER